MAHTVCYVLCIIGMSGSAQSNHSLYCIDNLDVNATDPPPTEMLMYFASEARLQQIVVPEMIFNCHGNITSWSALTIVKTVPDFLNNLSHELSFTVWRPRSGNTIYDLVGQSVLSFESTELLDGITQIDNSSGLAPSDRGYFRFIEKQPREVISFQPGDVVGWNVNMNVNSIRPALSVVYKLQNAGERSFDLVNFFANARETYCSVSVCNDTMNMTFSAVPYISVQYDGIL